MQNTRQSIGLIAFLIIIYVICLWCCHPSATSAREDDHVASPTLKRLIAYHGNGNQYFTNSNNRTFFYRNGKKIFIN